MAERRATRPRGGSTSATPNRFWNYPRPGYTGLHRWLPSWRFVLATVVGLGCLVVGALVMAYVSIDIPSATAGVRDETTKLYYAPEDGSAAKGELLATYPGIKRQIVDTTTLPDYVAHAVVASEDRTFYSNPGIDLRGIARAFLNNASGGARQGGSTLTQQYVENYYLGATHDYVGKVKEALLAIKIGRSQSKAQILDRYLNTIYFGRGAYGIQAAAQAYFGVDAKDLTVSQSALLAGIIPSPSNWDPAVGADQAKARWARALDYMVDEGWLSASDRAAQTFPTTVSQQVSATYAGPNGYVMMAVLKEAARALGVSTDDIARGGYTIVSTIRKPVQDQALQAANDLLTGKLSKGATPSDKLKVSMVTVDPTTGAVLGMYAGPNFVTDQVNRVTEGNGIQAGSTFKPFALITALQQGIPLSTRFNGNNALYIKGWSDSPDRSASVVHNFDKDNEGSIDLVQATAKSVNTVYAQLNMKIGATNTAETAKKAGLTTTISTANANVLGTSSVRPLEMAAAYGIIATGGMYATPHFIARMSSSDGSTAYTGSVASVRTFAADVMADTCYAMQQVVNYGTASSAVKPLGRHIAGKTGTSTDQKSAWFIGFTTKVVTAVGLSQVGDNGKDEVSISGWGGTTDVTGATYPSALWVDYMKPVLALPAYATDTPFPGRANVGGAVESTMVPSTSAAPAPTPTTQQPTTVAVPDGLVGRLEADAGAAVLAVGLTPRITSAASATVPDGRVISADPGSGTSVPVGSQVTLVVSTGPAPTPTPTPTHHTPAPSPSASATPKAVQTKAPGDG